MRKQGRRKRRIFRFGVASLFLSFVVTLLAIVFFVRGNTLRQQNNNYLAMEEKRVYSKTKEYIMEEAREIFGLQMPDEIIVKPEN